MDLLELHTQGVTVKVVSVSETALTGVPYDIVPIPAGHPTFVIALNESFVDQFMALPFPERDLYQMLAAWAVDTTMAYEQAEIEQTLDTRHNPE